MPPSLRSAWAIGTAIGGATALVGVFLTGAFLSAVTAGAPGSTAPFTELTARTVSPLQATVWTYFELKGVQPTVQWESATITRSVLYALTGESDTYAALRVLPPVLLMLAGSLTVVLTGRLSDGPSDSVTPLSGAYILLGYAPPLLLLLWVASVPVVGPDASRWVHVGNSVVDAASLAGVTAGPAPVPATLVALTFPVFFGVLGGIVAEVVSNTVEREQGLSTER
ncbi:hypothetical protein [Haloarcula salinisoli]|uniref:Uncharacterized protein n=1 Tax=Haloarcula salinisoli TaxID=2487746 RepID=A0A8J7YHH4_9EURY|nr:hypothetical protein [Halomicroarcula salinisoli]MBX0303558.1 hypothetical protein [Halomicroarcula salinisoli]